MTIKKKRTSILIFSLFLINFLFGFPTITKKNTLKEIYSCDGKIKLELIRIWGCEGVDDENFIFRNPIDMKINENGLIHILDSRNNNVKIFNTRGEYLKTIGTKGQGPGDLLNPSSMDLDKNGNIVIADYGNYRVQIYDLKGKYLKSFKTSGGSPSDIAISHNNEIATFSHQESFISRKLISIYNLKGNVIRKIGKAYDKTKSPADYESIYFVMDKDDNIYITFYATPLFQKYSYEGKPIMNVIFEMPFTTPRVSISDSHDEVNISGVRKERVSAGITVDKQGLIYIVATTRPKSELEKKTFYVYEGSGLKSISADDFDKEKSDKFCLLVFNKTGKIIAYTKLDTFCDNIHIYNNHLFIIDSYMNLKIYEYSVSFDFLEF